MKKKFKLLLVLVIAVLTLSMVGYAAWYITRDPKHVDGNVQAYAVTSDEITVKLCDEDGDEVQSASIIFGKPTGTFSNTGHWLQFVESGDPENLTVYFKVTATSAGKFTLSSSLKKGNNPEGATALFTGATFAQASGDGTFDANANTLEFTADNGGEAIISATYAWGLGKNPFEYFAEDGRGKTTELSETDLSKANSVLGTDWDADDHKTYKDFAKQYLEDLNTKCTGLTFVITVTDYNA